MQRIMKFAAVAGTAGMLAVGMSMPSYAAHGRNAAAAAGFGVGAIVGATAATAANDDNYGYRYDRDAYGYGPGYNSYARAPEYGPAYRAYDYVPPRSRSSQCPMDSYGQGRNHYAC